MTSPMRSIPFLLTAFLLSASAQAEAPVSLHDRILATMLRLSPPEKHKPPPGWEETNEQAMARYDSIATDIASVARSRMEAAALVGVAWHESGFAHDVDAGACYQAGAFKGRCDGGRATSIFQLQGGESQKYKEDRRAATKEALHRMLQSRKACSMNSEPERLAAYAGGNCDLLSSKAASRGLYAAIQRAREKGL